MNLCTSVTQLPYDSNACQSGFSFMQIMDVVQTHGSYFRSSLKTGISKIKAVENHSHSVTLGSA